MAGSRAVSDREPGQVRKEAALSGPAHAPRTSLAGAEDRRARPKASFDDGCTVHFLDDRCSRPDDLSRQYDGSADALALPPPPPEDLRRGGGPGERGAHAAQRDRARQGPPRLPVRRLARHRQDEHGQAARLRAERRGRPAHRLLPEDPACQGDHDRHLARRGGDGRRLEQLGRRHPRAARERRRWRRWAARGASTSSTRRTCSRPRPGTRS